MSLQTDNPPSSDDTGISALLLLLRFHGIAADAKQLAHQYGDTIGVAEILRCAKDMKLKARVVSSHWDRLVKTSLPAIAECSDGNFIIVSKVDEDGALIVSDWEG